MPIQIYCAACGDNSLPDGFSALPEAVYFHASGSLHLPSALSSDALLLDDRNPPVADADVSPLISLLQDKPLLLADFERPYHADFAALLEQLKPHIRALAVPPQYAAVPHEYLLSAPYQATCPLSDWLSDAAHTVADLRPVCCTLTPGGQPERIAFSVVRRQLRAISPRVFFSDALCCSYYSYIERSQPVFVFYDTPESFAKRQGMLGSAGVNFGIVLYAEYAALYDNR